MDERTLWKELFGESPSPPNTPSSIGKVAATDITTADAITIGPERPAKDVTMQEPEIDSTAPAATIQAEDIDMPEFEGASAAPATAQGKMPPPTAPASMLSNIKPSVRAIAKPITDPSAVVPLVSICVILFRQGRAVEAKKLGQFTIDIVGLGKWDAELAVFMGAEPLDVDKALPVRLLKDTISAMRALEASEEPSAASSADFLEGMLYAWEWI